MRVEPTVTPRLARRHLRAVVADDDPLMRAVISDLVRLEGYRVTAAADGEELLFHVMRGFAYEGRGAGGVDLIVSDLWMPFCSGLDVLRRLREVHRRVPIVIATGDDDSSLRSRIEALDGRFLAKPFTIDALHFAICQATDRPGAH